MGTCASTLRFFVAVDRGAWDPTTQLRKPYYRVNFIFVRELIAPASANTVLPLLLVWRASYVFACASILVGCLRLASSFFLLTFRKVKRSALTSVGETGQEGTPLVPTSPPLRSTLPWPALAAGFCACFPAFGLGSPFVASPEVCGLLRLFDWRPTVGVCECLVGGKRLTI